MKNRLSACAAAAVLLALGAAVSPAREFTDKNGRKIEAEIVAVREGKVQLKKSGDNRLFLVPVDTFSEDDQAFIKKWAVENIEYRFDVRAQEKKLEQDRKDSKSVEKWVYELEITNRTSADLTGITVHYNAFIQVTDERKGSGAYENEEMLVQGGALDIGKMEFNKAIRQTTKPVLLTQSESTGKEQTGVDCEENLPTHASNSSTTRDSKACGSVLSGWQ
ncbi:MAG: SHD1 domain-containing protein [Verrucomicrobiales bacterium]